MSVSDARLGELLAEGRAIPERGTGVDGREGHDHRVETARAVIRWAHEALGAELTVASSMGDEVLLDLVGTTVRGADVFFIDTGYHFDETLETRDAMEVLHPLTVRTLTPALTVAEQDAQYGPRLHDVDPDRCCAMRKVEPLERALADRSGWVTGMRRVDAPTRSAIPLVDLDEKRGMLKINPIAAWTDDDVETYARDRRVYQNPLRELGFASIGCAPCTRPVTDGEDARAGRWAGRAKTECGLHT